MPIVKCDYCGKNFNKIPCQIIRSKHHFCCPTCKSKYQQKPNIIVDKGTHAEIHIIKNNTNFIVLVSKEDINKINEIKWNLKYDETINNYYVQGHDRNVKEKNRKTLSLHRFLLDAPKDKVIDHINRNTLDNRRENLRIVDGIDNAQNKGFYSNNKSGYKYIYWDNVHGIYKCEIKRYKKIVFNKSCKNLKELVKIRDKFIKENIGLWQ